MSSVGAYNPAMRINRRLGAAAAIASALTIGSHASATVGGTNQQLTTGSAAAWQSTPAISGNLVVWTNTATVNGTQNSDIWYEDITVGRPAAVTQTPDQEVLEDIDGSNVVYSHLSATSAGDILVQDLSATGSTQSVVQARAGVHYEQPTINGRYIVYVKYTGTQADIEGYDNVLGFPLPTITNDAVRQASPRVSGDYIVFEDYTLGPSHPSVFGYQISTKGPVFRIATGPNNESMPDIDGNTVVWIESTATGDQVLSYDLTTRATTVLTTATSHKLLPRIGGNRVVWADDRNGNLDVYSYNFTTHTEDLIVGGPNDQMSVDISGNRVVYTDNSTGFESVWLYTIDAPPPPPTTTDKPIGCDPALTDPADTTVTLVRLNNKTQASANRSFTPQPNRHYYICVENGPLAGTQRTDQLMLVVDSTVVLTPADFKPNDNPPHWVSTAILDGNGHGKKPQAPGSTHSWSAALFGNQLPSSVAITLRVGK
jgi:beta propeller repeat protein